LIAEDFAKAPIMAAKACIGSATCRTIVTAVAVVAVAVACTARQSPETCHGG